MLRLKRNLHFEVHSAAPATKSALRGSQSAVPATKSALLGSQSAVYTEPHTIHCTCRSRNEIRGPRRSPPCPKRCACHEIIRNLHFEVKPLRSLAPVTNKVDFGPPKHEVFLAPATKSDHHARKCARRYNESAVATSTRRRHPDFASLRTRNTLRGFREARM